MTVENNMFVEIISQMYYVLVLFMTDLLSLNVVFGLVEQQVSICLAKFYIMDDDSEQ